MSSMDIGWIAHLLAQSYFLICREIERGQVDFKSGDRIRGNIHMSIKYLELPGLPISFLETFNLSDKEIEKYANEYQDQVEKGRKELK